MANINVKLKNASGDVLYPKTLWSNIEGKPSIYPTNWGNIAGNPLTVTNTKLAWKSIFINVVRLSADRDEVVNYRVPVGVAFVVVYTPRSTQDLTIAHSGTFSVSDGDSMTVREFSY